MCYGRDEFVVYNTPCCVITEDVRAGSEGRGRTWFAPQANDFSRPHGVSTGANGPIFADPRSGVLLAAGASRVRRSDMGVALESAVPETSVGTFVSVSLAQPTRLHRAMYANGVTLALLKLHMPVTAKTSQATSWLSRHTSSGGENKREREGRGMPRGL